MPYARADELDLGGLQLTALDGELLAALCQLNWLRGLFLGPSAEVRDGIAAMDLFVVPTISFQLLYGLFILRHDRRQIIWFGVTRHPTAEWIARQLVEAHAWQPMPKYVLRDRDRAYGVTFKQRMKAMGIRDRPISPRSPWQNACAA